MAGYVGTKAVLLSTTAANVGGDADIGGDLTVGGAFTSQGIDDNATSTTMTLDASGNIGINGTTSASDGVFRLIQIGGTNKYATFGAQANGGFAALMGSNFYYNGGWKRTDAGRVTKIETGPDSSSEELFSFQYAGDGAADSAISWSEAMRLDASGNLLVGTTDSTLVGRPDTARLCVDNENGEDCIQIRGSGSDHLNIASWVPVTGNAYHIGFGSGTSSYTEHGVISTNGSTTTYSTTSDHRLKENVVDLEGAAERLKQLRPKRFNFIVNPNTILDGFLAHEAQVVVPEAVTGTRDAMRDESYEVTPAVTDDDGNVTTEAVMGTRSVPAYQGIDQSKLVPLLVAALQEALDEITDLKARVAALEAN